MTTLYFNSDNRTIDSRQHALCHVVEKRQKTWDKDLRRKSKVNNTFAKSFPQYSQLKYNTTDVKELTCPIPQCPLPTGGCVQSMGSRARIPWFCAGWIQCSCGTLVCSAPTLSILSHLCLPYISFPHQKTLQHRCILWRQFLCSVFYDNGEFIALRRDLRTFLFFS